MSEDPELLSSTNASPASRFNWHAIIGIALTVFVWIPILIAAAAAFLNR